MHFTDIYFQAGENPVICYRSGLTVYEEAFGEGSLYSCGWNTAGYPLNVLSGCRRACSCMISAYPVHSMWKSTVFLWIAVCALSAVIRKNPKTAKPQESN